MKRIFDFCVSLAGLIILIPLFIVIAVVIVLDSGWPVFYLQKRVGLNSKDFRIVKFRTMYRSSDKKGLLTVGKRDDRITKAGYWLRRFKLDELPQLFNVLIGEMSLVGPRPEVRKYVDTYSDEQKKVLSVRPGITDLASIAFINENQLLLKFQNPEAGYVEEILPLKLQANLTYVRSRTFFSDLKIIFLTLTKMIKQ